VRARGWARFGAAFVLVALLGVVAADARRVARPAAPASPPNPADQKAATGPTYAQLSDRAMRTLLHQYYDGAGRWRICGPHGCGVTNQDWGAAAMTYTLYLYWHITRDPRVPPVMTALAATALTYGPGTSTWSDQPQWDSVAASREYQVTGDATALAKAKAAFALVDSDRRAQFAAGACPAVNYQLPNGGDNKLKTLETDSNYVKAATLLFQVTGDRAYLDKAVAKYAAIRQYFLDRASDLYTVYVFDNGNQCTPLAGRYFASVNGNMIWAGYHLARATGLQPYHDQALATARAVQDRLGDATGVYAALQAENDVTEPLVEAMYDLAALDRQDFARDWLLAAADASASSVAPTGAYGRFFAGPAPTAPITVWQTNGGLALQFAAGALNPTGAPGAPGAWERAVSVPLELTVTTTPAGFTFTGRAIAIIGTIGEQCCESGHARVFIDGVETMDRTGIWQNKSSSGRRLPGSVLFAWRWPASGVHTIRIEPGEPNAKEGGPFFHMTGYQLIA
jgi:hypothetical protein